ncbi:MAG: spermidine/putrescine ABC transporter substrate-binding protein [Dehalococcoidia bacterium]|nr:spermidine/putrescine ABC transporter substrate-binding protein [Dehalococcoidia bacterium]
MAEISDSWRRLWGRRITRRRLMAGTALGAAGLATAAVLGCEDEGAPAGTPTGEALTGPLNFSNWPLYIDEQTLPDFEAQFGITVNYKEDINDNNEFFAKIRQPLSQGQDIGRDIIVLTDWMAGRLIRLGYVDELNKDNIPNWVNLVDALKNPSFDPGREFSLPWQSGFTGIGYNPKLTGRELKSVNDIFDPKFEGKVTMLTEMRDTIGLVMLGLGRDPTKATVDDVRAVVEKVQPFADSGHIRAFTGNEYGDDLARGDVWAAIAWSGDVIQLQVDNPDLQFLFPEEGFMLWSDNMMIPKNAAHKATAEAFMNFYYDPKITAQVEAYVQYIPPVKGTKEEMAKIDPALAENPIIFPSEDVLAKSRIFKALDEEEDREFNELFQALTGL